MNRKNSKTALSSDFIVLLEFYNQFYNGWYCHQMPDRRSQMAIDQSYARSVS